MCLLVVMLPSCFAGVLARGEQFAYRDAGHYYYPIYQSVQRQWQTGRLPLWEPEENGGMPLLGNPTAAVLYPGKILYAVLPYPWAARAYILAHVALAYGLTFALARSLGLGGIGAILAALSYAFGVPVLFMQSNVIYLVGAAWMPLGWLGAHLGCERRRRSGLFMLAVALAMPCLGGDLEAAYLTGLVAAGYAAYRDLVPHARSVSVRRWVLAGGLVLAGWVALTALVAPAWQSIPARPGWFPSGDLIRVVAWGGVLAWLIRAARRVETGMARGSKRRPDRLSRVLAASLLAGLVAAAQLVPTAEVASRSFRNAAESPFDPYAFQVEPWRAIELLWPNVTGEAFPENHNWLLTLAPERGQQFWTPSLYLGGWVVVLAGVAVLSRSVSPRHRRGRVWLAAIAGIGLLASFGSRGGPLWVMRQVPPLAAIVGPSDDAALPVPRGESRAPDHLGSVYGVMAAALPMFGSFRFPAKLMVPASLALALLAGLGWEALRRGRAGQLGAITTGIAVTLGGLGLIGTIAWGEALIESWDRLANACATLAGPLDARGALHDLRNGLIQGTIVALTVVLLARLARIRPLRSGLVVLVVAAVDLILANGRLVWTVPQAILDREPAALRTIREAEAGQEPTEAGPFRVHRMAPWYPARFLATRSPDRLAEIVAWERDTLQPSHGVPLGVAYTFSPGVLEPVEFVWFFRPMPRPLDRRTAEAIGGVPGRPVLYHPRRSLDLWNTRYFLLPFDPGDWLGESRGFAAMLENTTRLVPDPATSITPESQAAASAWIADHDWQLWRNEAAYPRAWIVHDARVVEPVDPRDPTALDRAMRRLLYANDPLWSEPGRPVIDTRTTAVIESDDLRLLTGVLDRGPVTAAERVAIVRHEPDRVELAVNLERPGLVLLSETFDPGWRLTIDGRPAPILRANRMMRAAFVMPGSHTLVYTYRPRSVLVGGILSMVGLAGLALGSRPWRWGTEKRRG